jgi:hypothetical protein
MGTTLTGLTPATTYDALIKVGDNGPLSATAKYVGDGLGNDSVVALSTSSVGIGTASPTQLLHVAGNVRITGALYDGNNAAGTSGQILSSTGTGTDWVSKSDLSLVDGSGTANYVSKWSDTDTLTNSIIYDNGSAVGIGTTSNSYTSAGRGNLNIAGSAGAILGFQIGGAAKGYVFHDNTNLQLWNEVAGDLLFGTNAIEYMRITAAGGIGIGTSSPAEKLDVVGGALAAGNGTIRTGITYSTLGLLGTFTAHDLGLITNGTEKARITSAGDVGIGTSSPTNQGAGVTSLDVTGSAGGSLTTKGSSVTGEFLALDAAGGLYISTKTSHPMILRTADVERLRITEAGLIGIGTSSPQTKFQIGGVGDANANAASISFGDGNSINSRNWAITNGLSAGGANQVGALTFSVSNALNGNPLSAGVEVARFDPSGNLSITTGNIALSGAGGIYFDNAASKYLDDYEEGTWTMGVSFGGASVGVTYSLNTGTYTKIGRQVTVNGYIALTSKGSSSGVAKLTGLPFTIPNSASNYSTAGLWFVNVSFDNQFQGNVQLNSTFVELYEITEAGAVTSLTDADFANNSEVMVSLTYFV